MAYHVQTVATVEEYIDNLPGLSAEGKRALVTGYLSDLANRADYFLQTYPFSHESYRFWYTFAFADGSSIYEFRFLADGENREQGVVTVLYVDHERIDAP